MYNLTESPFTELLYLYSFNGNEEYKAELDALAKESLIGSDRGVYTTPDYVSEEISDLTHSVAHPLIQKGLLAPTRVSVNPISFDMSMVYLWSTPIVFIYLKSQE